MMNKRFVFIIIVVIIVGVGTHQAAMPSHRFSIEVSSFELYNQEKPPKQSVDTSLIFNDIQQGLAQSDIKIFSNHFARELYLNLRGGESGYYSSDQASYILQNFFRSRRTINFKFSTVSEVGEMPYATGGGIFLKRGTRETLQVYVGLTKYHEKWVITQFNVY
jgi:hypothetical protein